MAVNGAEEAIYILVAVGVMLLLGILSSIISKKLNISEVILLIGSGMLLGIIRQARPDLFVFNHTFLIAISILALSLIVFDGTSKLSLWELDKLSLVSLKAIGGWLLINATIFAFICMTLISNNFTVDIFLACVIFAVMMVGTDPGSVFTMLKDKSNKAIEFLKIEAVFNTPLIVIFPILLLDLKNTWQTATVVDVFLATLKPFFLKIIVGIGTGFLIGAVMFKAMKRFYSNTLSPISLVTGALLAYGTAEVLGGDGVLSVATLGLFFGQVYLKEKTKVMEFNSVISNSLNILVFVLLGVMISLPANGSFYIKSGVLFIILIFLRFLSLKFSFRKEKENYASKDVWFMALMMPKGTAIAALAFTLSILNDPQINIILEYVLIFMIYSIILSTVVTKMFDKFYPKIIEENKN